MLALVPKLKAVTALDAAFHQDSGETSTIVFSLISRLHCP
jgi:hypothetical protein